MQRRSTAGRGVSNEKIINVNNVIAAGRMGFRQHKVPVSRPPARLCYHSVMHLFAALWLLIHLAQSLPVPGIPDLPGVHIRKDDASWISLQKASFAKTETKGLDLFIQTGGYTSLDLEVVCPGARAATRLTTPRPVFYVRDAGPSNDVMVIQLTRKKDSRSFRKSSADTTIENKEGLRKKDIRKAAVTKYPDGTFSITPEVDLKPGEYLLALGNTSLSFDFGVDGER